MRYDRDRKIRSSGAPKRVFARKDETGVVRLLVDVWWHLLLRARDCAGGRKVVPEVTLCWQSPPRPLPLPSMTRDRMASLMESSFFSRKMFIGGLSWQTSPGMWQTLNSDRIISIWQFCTMDVVAMASIIRSRTSPVLQERESERCWYYFLLRVFAVIIYRLIHRHAFFSLNVLSIIEEYRGIIDKLTSGFFMRMPSLTGTWLTDCDDWIFL